MQYISDMTITGMGGEALSFVQEKMLILFSDHAGNGLEDYSVLISMPVFSSDLKTGDTMFFGKHAYRITSIGSKAMETFRLLGHCTLRFDGSEEAVLPGSMHLEDLPLPEINIGDKIAFV